jgi:hypothetical protein
MRPTAEMVDVAERVTELRARQAREAGSPIGVLIFFAVLLAIAIAHCTATN